MKTIRKYAKGVTAFLVFVVAGGITQGLINGAAAAWATIIIGALGTTGVLVARNKPARPLRARRARGDAGLGLIEVAIVLIVIALFLIVAGVLPPK